MIVNDSSCSNVRDSWNNHQLSWPFERALSFDWFVLSMRMQVILDSSFARPGSAPIYMGRKERSIQGLD